MRTPHQTLITQSMRELLQELARERCLSRRRQPPDVLSALQARYLVEVHKGWVELSQIGRLVVLGLEAEELLRRRPLRADRSGGGPVIESCGAPVAPWPVTCDLKPGHSGPHTWFQSDKGVRRA